MCGYISDNIVVVERICIEIIIDNIIEVLVLCLFSTTILRLLTSHQVEVKSNNRVHFNLTYFPSGIFIKVIFNVICLESVLINIITI